MAPDGSNARGKEPRAGLFSERRTREVSNGKCQLLLSEKSILAAMAYVDLNPIRAKVADSVTSSKHTSIRVRGKAVRGNLKAAAQPLNPLMGCQSYNLPTLTEGEYIDLVDYTGRQIYPGKRGKIKESEPNGYSGHEKPRFRCMGSQREKAERGC